MSDEPERWTDAKTAGALCRMFGVSVAENPYPVFSESWCEWEAGWHAELPKWEIPEGFKRKPDPES